MRRDGFFRVGQRPRTRSLSERRQRCLGCGESASLLCLHRDPFFRKAKPDQGAAAREDETAAEKTAALEEAIGLARASGDPFLVRQAMHGIGDVCMSLRDDAAAEPWHLASVQRAREIGDAWSLFDTQTHLGWGYANRGELGRARQTFAEALRSAAAAGARAAATLAACPYEERRG